MYIIWYFLSLRNTLIDVLKYYYGNSFCWGPNQSVTNTGGGLKLLFGQGIRVVVITGKDFISDNVKLESWYDMEYKKKVLQNVIVLNTGSTFRS